MTELYVAIMEGILQIVKALIGVAIVAVVIPWIRNEVIPWLHEKRIYSLVSKLVRAAEKMYEAGSLTTLKKDFVVGLLKNKGNEVTPEVDAFIESAVKELDIAVDSGFDWIVNEFEEEASEENGAGGDADV